MEDTLSFSRRRFLKQSLWFAGGSFLFVRCSLPGKTWCFINDEVTRILDAIADQIIPPDEWDGGANAGVTEFIDQQFF